MPSSMVTSSGTCYLYIDSMPQLPRLRWMVYLVYLLKQLTRYQNHKLSDGIKKESGEMKCLHGVDDATYWPTDSSMTTAIDQVGIISMLY